MTHSLKAIARCVQDFKRVHVCLKDGWDLGRTSQATGLSGPLVAPCVDMTSEEAILPFDEVPF